MCRSFLTFLSIEEKSKCGRWRSSMPSGRLPVWMSGRTWLQDSLSCTPGGQSRHTLCGWLFNTSWKKKQPLITLSLSALCLMKAYLLKRHLVWLWGHQEMECPLLVLTENCTTDKISKETLKRIYLRARCWFSGRKPQGEISGSGCEFLQTHQCFYLKLP